MQHTSINDDLYFSPEDKVYSNDQYAFDNSETGKRSSYVQNEEMDKKISSLLSDESKEVIDTTIYIDEETGNPYQDIIVDDYQEAYQRRLDAKQSGYYGITNNYFVMSSDDYWYASAYLNDPFYNVIIVGNQVWVEPSWMTSSFGYYRYGYPYYGYYGGYYSYYGYPYYNYYDSYYYHRPYFYPYYTINNYYENNNWAGSSLNSYRRGSLTTTNPDGSYRADRSGRLPETYLGNDIKRTRTLKDGLDDQSGTSIIDRRTERTKGVREIGNQNTERTTRVVNKERTRTDVITRQDNTQKRTGSSTNNATYTRTSRQGTSTYDASKRTSSTRYTRPAKSSGNGDSYKPSSGSSTYSPGRSGSSTKSGGSTYTPARSSGNSGGSVKSSPSRSSSGSSKSSGSSSGSSSRSERGGRK
ncbi:MAG: hypothetical protein A2W99_09575 [Bacteroidetes bacterium GWF2_33_16]|nr:MAG: hypothetical protein A2X00_06485 [Bacteroidetes bacterium GWE2_32_14]OFY07242.1 MAG: hypothetical protein A2W99_09575 [Bacteroidetes bacterium GWF2_33_16]